MSNVVNVGVQMNSFLAEGMPLPRACAEIVHLRPVVKGDGSIEMQELAREITYNVITNAGRDFIHSQSYNTTTGANGLNFIALSNDTLTETATSTTLSTEITTNGLARVQGAYAHTTGTNTTTISNTFTCATASQAAQKAALFTASSAGTMNHALSFTQRTLQVGDQLQITFTITIG